MAAEQTRTTAGRPVSRGTLVKFWIGVVVVVVAVVVGAVVILNRSGNETRETVDRLNARYVEKIDIEYASRARSSTDLIVIDGTPRYDCSEENAVLTCSDDPQPTLEK